MAGESLHTLRQLVDRLARRIRTQRALEGFVTGATASLLATMLALVLYKTTWIELSHLTVAAVASLALPLAMAVWAWTRPLDKVALAHKLDRAHHLHDRLSTALYLSEKGESSPFVDAQIDDAIRHLDVVRIAPAAPFTRPTDLIPLVLVVAVVAGLVFLPEFEHQGELPPPIEIVHAPVLDEATVALERDRLEQIKRELEGVQDPEAQELVEEIEALLDAVEDREITERQFLEELDRIEKEFFEEEEKTTDQVAEALKEAAEELEEEAGKDLEKSPEMKELVDALKEKDMEGASDALGNLAEKLANDEMSQKDLERMAKLMEKFADSIDPTDPALRELYEKNKEAFDELAKKFGDKENMTEDEKQRLDRAKKNMEQAQRQQNQAEQEEAARRLKQLKRKYETLSEDAEKVIDSDKGRSEKEANAEGETSDDADYADEAGRKAKDLQKEAQKDSQGQKAGEAKKKAQEQIEQMREAMKRSQSGKSGQGGQEGEERAERMKEFLERAKGQKPAEGQPDPNAGQKPEGGKEGKPGSSESVKKGEGKGESGKQPGPKDGRSDNPMNSDEEAKAETDFAGKGEGSRKLGEETDLDSKRKDEKVEGQLAEGASRSEIIKDASERGFATTRYKDVYVDYEEVVEEVMEKEKVPSGYRYYVKRYFQLIKPQE